MPRRIKLRTPKPIPIGKFKLAVSLHDVKTLEKVLSLLENGKINLHSFLEVAQYDFSSLKNIPRSARSALRTIANRARIGPNKLRKLTSGTALFALAVYIALKELLETRNCIFYPEPVLDGRIPFDYAIVCDDLLLIAEVKRISKAIRLAEYLKYFAQKVGIVFQDNVILVLHVHIVSEKEDKTICEVLRAFNNIFRNLNLKLRIIVTSFTDFCEALRRQISAILG